MNGKANAITLGNLDISKTWFCFRLHLFLGTQFSKPLNEALNSNISTSGLLLIIVDKLLTKFLASGSLGFKIIACVPEALLEPSIIVSLKPIFLVVKMISSLIFGIFSISSNLFDKSFEKLLVKIINSKISDFWSKILFKKCLWILLE